MHLSIQHVVLQNQLETGPQADLARPQIAQTVQCRATARWKRPGTRPFLVIPIAVVQNRKGKMRLIVDGRILNLRLARVPIRFETAADAMRMFADMDCQ